MENNIKKEQWIDGVVGSTQGMKRAVPAAGLYEKVAAGLNNPQAAKSVAFPVRQWAAAAILLLSLNLCSILYVTSHKNRSAQEGAGNPFATEIPSVSTYNY